MQKTLTIDGNKITLKTKARTSYGNIIGYRTSVIWDSSKAIYDCMTLDIQEAMDKAYVKWVKEYTE